MPDRRQFLVAGMGVIDWVGRIDKVPDGYRAMNEREYRTKYRRDAASIINTIVSPEARSTTIKLVPCSTGSQSNSKDHWKGKKQWNTRS